MAPKLSIIAEVDDNKKLDGFIRNVKASLAGISCEMLLLCEENDLEGVDLASVCGESFSVKPLHDDRKMPERLNTALAEAKGDVIHFTKSSCEYENKAIKDAVSLLDSQGDAHVACLDAAGFNSREEVLDVMPFIKKLELTKPVIIDLNKEPDRWCRALFSLFIDRDAALKVSFSTALEYEYERVYLAQLMADCDRYWLVPEKVTTTGSIDRDYYNYRPLYDKDWYLKELVELTSLVAPLEDTKRINQRLLLDFVKIQFSANSADRDKTIIEGSLLEEYIAKVKDTLKYIDDDIIATAGREVLPARVLAVMDHTFLCLKHNVDAIKTKAVLTDAAYTYYDGFTGEKYDFLTDSGAVLASSEIVHLGIKTMNRQGDKIVVDAVLANAYFDDKNNIKVVIVSDDGEEIVAERTEVYSLRKFFGVTVYRGYTMRFELPLEGAKHREYTARVEAGDAIFYPPWKFTKGQSRINHHHRHSFWEIAGKTFKYDEKRHKLVVRKSNVLSRIGNEIAYWPDIMEHCVEKKRALAFIALRILYYLTRPYYKHKNVWMTFDQLFKGGDNGEYFYRYVSDLKNNHQTIYYVVNKNTKEYKELSKKYKTVLEYSSLKHKLISLHTNIMFTTRASVMVYAGFAKSAEGYFRGLCNFDTVCLQHGLSIQQIAQYQNRVYDNLKYYFCVSKYEIANLSKPIYGFDDKSVLRLTGAPRYDGLTGEAKRQIIITPTWRRNVTAGTNKKGSNHQYSVNFKHTKYFQIYNRLINDPKLIECAQRTGYKLIYLIHPILSPQLKDFDKNDVVDIVPGSKVNYEKILVESALMLTDHSGIMYDFAYQRKPLVYYHPDELPPQYAEGGLDYETMGFGPICKTHDQIVDELCKFMENDCKLDPKYAERIEDFFEFDDQNNCERVYQAALDFEKKYQS